MIFVTHSDIVRYCVDIEVEAWICSLLHQVRVEQTNTRQQLRKITKKDDEQLTKDCKHIP